MDGTAQPPELLLTSETREVMDEGIHVARMRGSEIEAPAALEIGDPKAPVRSRLDLAQAVANPRKWSAEEPNLYRLILTLKDVAGKVLPSGDLRSDVLIDREAKIVLQ